MRGSARLRPGKANARETDPPRGGRGARVGVTPDAHCAPLHRARRTRAPLRGRMGVTVAPRAAIAGHAIGRCATPGPISVTPKRAPPNTGARPPLGRAADAARRSIADSGGAPLRGATDRRIVRDPYDHARRPSREAMRGRDGELSGSSVPPVHVAAQAAPTGENREAPTSDAPRGAEPACSYAAGVGKSPPSRSHTDRGVMRSQRPLQCMRSGCSNCADCVLTGGRWRGFRGPPTVPRAKPPRQPCGTIRRSPTDRRAAMRVPEPARADG